ncbi:MAG: NADP-dependent malic enzyme [Bacteroidales bacterium]|nr:NADP-dependent malic enzyme [Porphyromonas sp.]MDD7437443.1 NADP-dependent malic enzyme [Bacteroidales bacterium]MDY3067200.1 NADP-dependent malic enzyme [Porphyromonas sp.]
MMKKDLSEAARAYHSLPQPGKIEVRPTKPYLTQHDLTLAYSPGVAVPCLDIEQQPEQAYDYTSKGNLVAVISNGTAVLGLGDIGALAGKPVMEGKGLLFKIYAGIDVFDIEIDEKDPVKFVEIVKSIAPTFGGINLEDIKAPECFYIEQELKKQLDIPVMHDDQHGTAIISAAGLLNALKIADKKIEEVKIVVSGAGASALSCTRLYVALGARIENIVMLDSKGAIRKDRPGLSEEKAYFATERDVHGLSDAIVGADVFLGLSRAGVLKPEMVQQMAPNPIIFALANPDPEITYEDAMAARPDVLMATGRSDYPNQINNVIGFPYIFRGALDVRATGINEEMKMAATKAIAELAHEPVPEEVSLAYGNIPLHFGPSYFIPKPVDPRLIVRVSVAVAKAAVKSGVARKSITDWEAYEEEVYARVGNVNSLLRRVYNSAKLTPRRLVFAAGEHTVSLKAAVEVLRQGIAQPIVLGDPESIQHKAMLNELDLTGVKIINHHSPEYRSKRTQYAEQFAKQNWRKGGKLSEARDKMYDPNYFGMMMVQCGDAEGMITGLYSNYNHLKEIALSTVGVKEGFNHFATMHMVSLKKGPLFLVDTLINQNLKADTLVDITLLAADKVRCLGLEPNIAVVNFSDFGSDGAESSIEARKAVAMLHEKYPDLHVDGEMQVTTALNMQKRDEEYPDNWLKGQKVNILVFPRLSAANACYQLLKSVESAEDVVGPIQIGLAKPIYFVDHGATVKEIVNVAVMTSLDTSGCLR